MTNFFFLFLHESMEKDKIDELSRAPILSGQPYLTIPVAGDPPREIYFSLTGLHFTSTPDIFLESVVGTRLHEQLTKTVSDFTGGTSAGGGLAPVCTSSMVWESIFGNYPDGAITAHQNMNPVQAAFGVNGSAQPFNGRDITTMSQLSQNPHALPQPGVNTAIDSLAFHEGMSPLDPLRDVRSPARTLRERFPNHGFAPQNMHTLQSVIGQNVTPEDLRAARRDAAEVLLLVRPADPSSLWAWLCSGVMDTYLPAERRVWILESIVNAPGFRTTLELCFEVVFRDLYHMNWKQLEYDGLTPGTFHTLQTTYQVLKFLGMKKHNFLAITCNGRFSPTDWKDMGMQSTEFYDLELDNNELTVLSKKSGKSWDSKSCSVVFA